MKRYAILVFVFCVAALTLIISSSNAQRNTQQAHAALPPPAGKISVPCPQGLNKITDCSDTGWPITWTPARKELIESDAFDSAW